MARSKSTKAGNTVEFPAPETAEHPPERPEPETKPAPEPEARIPSRNFVDKLKKIAADDWGARVRLYLYRLEPIIDRLRGSENKYIMSYEEAIDEDRILADHGSGKYQAILVWTKPGADKGESLDRYIFNILNIKHPPKIPAGEWVDDPRNKKWSWAKASIDSQSQPAKNGMAELVDAVRVVNQIRRDAKEESPAVEQADPTGQFSNMVSAAARLVELSRPQVAATPASDPYDVAAKILQMRSDNPMVDMMRDELKAMREELRDARTEERKLQMELLEARLKPPEQKEDLLDRLEKLGEHKEKIAKALGLAVEAAEEIRTKPLPAWVGLAKEVIGGIANSPLGGAIAQWMLTRNQPAPNGFGNAQPHTAPAPAVDIRPQPAGQQPNQPPPQNFMQFVEAITPTMLRYLEAGSDGDDFADWLYAGYPEQFLQVQNLEHPMMPGMKGAQVIINLYRQSPYWQRIALHEARFVKFVQDFCKWKPGQEEEIPEAETEEPGEGEDAERINV